MILKTCKKCGQSKEIDDFPNGKSKSGIKCKRGTCKECTAARGRQLYKGWVRREGYVEPKIHWGECTMCHKEFQQTSRFFRQRKQLKIKVYCSKECAAQRTPSHLLEHWRLKVMADDSVRTFNNIEFEYSVQKAKIIRTKEYFKRFRFDAEDMVSAAYILMTEKGMEYTRRSFYLLIWNAMGRERYRQIKANPAMYERYLERERQRNAIATLKMLPCYVNKQIRKSKAYKEKEIYINDESVINKRAELQKHREKSTHILKGEVLNYYDNRVPLVINYREN